MSNVVIHWSQYDWNIWTIQRFRNPLGKYSLIQTLILATPTLHRAFRPDFYLMKQYHEC